MSLENYIDGDPRMSINEGVAKECLDKIRDALNDEGLPDDSYHIIMTAIAVLREKKVGVIPDYECINKFDSTKGTRQILNYIRLKDEYLAFLYSEAIKELAPDNIDGILNFKKVSELWSKWAEEGLKILYCNYFTKYYHRKGDIHDFLNKIYNFGRD